MKSSFHIALIAASPAVIGGHSVQAEAMAAGHQVSYVPIDVRFPRRLQWLRRLRFVRTFVNELFYVLSLYRIARADVVHVFSASYWSFLLGPAPAILAARLLRKPVIVHYHSGEADDHLRRWRFVVRPLLLLADEIIVPSAYLERVFTAHGYQTRVIPNCIDTSRFQYRERTIPRPRLLSARNLELYYGVDTIIDAFVQLKGRFPQATLTIVGQGSQERALRAQAENVSGIRFAGAVDPAAMPDTYDDADIFVNASVIDNQPVSILEAFASGLPVVSTSTGDIAAMLRDGEAGLLVDADPAAIANAVTRLLGQPDLFASVAQRARDEAERYTWRRVGAEWNALYTALLSTTREEVLAHG
jgi:glycosyltransferase involved in cell wall biosynthesis